MWHLTPRCAEDLEASLQNDLDHHDVDIRFFVANYSRELRHLPSHASKYLRNYSIVHQGLLDLSIYFRWSLKQHIRPMKDYYLDDIIKDGETPGENLYKIARFFQWR
jgi:hypothetical protein